MKKWKDQRAILLLVLLCAFFYVFTLRGVHGNPTPADFKGNLDRSSYPFELSPERGRFSHVLSLGEYGSYALPKALVDVAYPDVGYYEGRFYSFFAPGLPYMALPLYKLGALFNLSQVFTFAFVSLMSILAAVFLYKIARDMFDLSVRAGILAALVFAFGSTAWSYAITLYQHHVTAFFMLSSFYAAWRFRTNASYSWLYAAGVWLIYALAITIDYPNAILLVPVMAYFVLSAFGIKRDKTATTITLRTGVATAAVTFILITGIHLYHNHVHFGSWHTLSGGLVSYKGIIQQDLLSQQGSAALLAKLKEGKDIVAFFKETNVPQGLGVLLFSLERGVFVYAPIVVIALIGIFLSLKRNRSAEFITAVSIIMLNILLYASWGDPWGGWAYGPRYLIPSLAFLALFIGVALERSYWRVEMLHSTFLLFIYSSAVALLGALTTNAVPPKHEGIYLEHVGRLYDFALNIKYLTVNVSGSFIYNTYFASSPLPLYFLALFIPLLIVVGVLLFVHPRKRNEH